MYVMYHAWIMVKSDGYIMQIRNLMFYMVKISSPGSAASAEKKHLGTVFCEFVLVILKTVIIIMKTVI